MTTTVTVADRMGSEARTPWRSPGQRPRKPDSSITVTSSGVKEWECSASSWSPPDGQLLEEAGLAKEDESLRALADKRLSTQETPANPGARPQSLAKSPKCRGAEHGGRQQTRHEGQEGNKRMSKKSGSR